ncbi:MAG: hypothetical protein ABSG04_06770 [Verrucomicrobiota bacterium]
MMGSEKVPRLGDATSAARLGGSEASMGGSGRTMTPSAPAGAEAGGGWAGAAGAAGAGAGAMADCGRIAGAEDSSGGACFEKNRF